MDYTGQKLIFFYIMSEALPSPKSPVPPNTERGEQFNIRRAHNLVDPSNREDDWLKEFKAIEEKHPTADFQSFKSFKYNELKWGENPVEEEMEIVNGFPNGNNNPELKNIVGYYLDIPSKGTKALLTFINDNTFSNYTKGLGDDNAGLFRDFTYLYPTLLNNNFQYGQICIVHKAKNKHTDPLDLIIVYANYVIENNNHFKQDLSDALRVSNHDFIRIYIYGSYLINNFESTLSNILKEVSKNTTHKVIYASIGDTTLRNAFIVNFRDNNYRVYVSIGTNGIQFRDSYITPDSIKEFNNKDKILLGLLIKATINIAKEKNLQFDIFQEYLDATKIGDATSSSGIYLTEKNEVVFRKNINEQSSSLNTVTLIPQLNIYGGKLINPIGLILIALFYIAIVAFAGYLYSQLCPSMKQTIMYMLYGGIVLCFIGYYC